MVDLLIIGAGERGSVYAGYAAKHPNRCRVVGVAEPRQSARQRLADAHGIPLEHQFADWRDAVALPAFANAATVTVQDSMHADVAIPLAQKGYHLLLEKPMATSAADCEAIAAAINDQGLMCAVAHVLRYTPYTKKLKDLLKRDSIGDIVNVQHLEPVGYWHQAHSFVRGNWGKEAESTFMLMAKSCHDIDLLAYLIDQPCSMVSSFGGLQHFKRDVMPEGASGRCLECQVEPECPYSAKKIYLDAVKAGHSSWPVSVITEDRTPKGVLEALRSGPYGRCVYACDNDVVDHQVVNLQFKNGVTASFTMTGFTEAQQFRKTRIFGTHGQIVGDGDTISVHTFLTEETIAYDMKLLYGETTDGHGGGDHALMDHFVRAIAEKSPHLILSPIDESLATHRVVFAAETSRRQGKTIQLREFKQ